MKNSSKLLSLTFAEKCKNILSSNWQGMLHTIKADCKGSKEELHSSKIKYFFKKGKPYIWIPEKDLHNVNAMIDERGSLTVTNPFPGSLGNLLRSIKKLPTRVAITGDIVPLKDEKVRLIEESLRDTILSEEKVIREASYSVSGILTSSSMGTVSRSQNLQEILDGDDSYMAYKFELRSCSFVDGVGSEYDVELADIGAAKADLLSPYYTNLVDGINQSQARRRALMLFCHVYMNVAARDVLLLSLDRRGIDVLARVMAKEGSEEYQWREFRFTFKEEASNIETFCRLLVEMEEEVLEKVKSFSGL